MPFASGWSIETVVLGGRSQFELGSSERPLSRAVVRVYSRVLKHMPSTQSEMMKRSEYQ
jgi:hypothetical protein